ncbi:funZ protein [Flavobacterium sp. LaA7.5]|nr:funZ protein [Flavobacterium salilacus subsp. altitudinum]
MKSIDQLNFGFNDAENYKRPENKAIFDKFFLRTKEFNDVFKPSTNFIIGEKGTGKTAYATYIVNNETYDTVGFINFMRETDYQKFITLKKDNHLQLSDYQNVWKVILYLLLSNRIKNYEHDNNNFFKSTRPFDALQKAIDEYYLNAFSPEIINALNFVEKTKNSAEIMSKYFKLLGENVQEGSFTHSKFQTNLLYIQSHFEKAIGSLNFSKNYIIFIDGIDIRPENIPYSDYLECIKGLANALWSLNNDFFPSIKSERKIKVILLIRPDIFANLGLQNQNNKLKDNSILLDWKTNYSDYRSSELFGLADRILMAQQDNTYLNGKCWDYYFPYKINKGRKEDDSFIQFLRYSFYRPRDIITLLDLIKDIHIRSNKKHINYFSEDEFFNSEVQTRYSDYLMGEIKDFLTFYYSDSDYELFRKFFEFLNNKNEFKYDFYIKAFSKFEEYRTKNNIKKPKFFETADTFLQFIFELNIICYIETDNNKKFIRWSFRERNYSNISPKVKSNCTYQIHYGLAKNLNLEKTFFHYSYKNNSIKRPNSR